MIFLVILLIIIIVWLQYPEINSSTNENEKPLYIKIFNNVKIPLIVICFIIIIYSTINIIPIDPTKNLNVYMAIPKY